MLEMKDTDTFEISPSIFLQKISELKKYWAFNTDTGEHYTLNKTSYWILERIAGGAAVEDMVQDFLGTFDVEEKEGTRDFNEIIKNFLDEGIIERRER
ncbi:MAG: PqqD family protein [Pseudomonadota bacterium]